jgi:hypothetical protein
MGGNAAIPRKTLERFGLWDECTPIEDEPSLAYRINAGKRADEYAGRILAAVSGDLRAAIADYRTRGDALHGTGDERAAILLMGYLRAGGKLPDAAKQRLAAQLIAKAKQRRAAKQKRPAR